MYYRRPFWWLAIRFFLVIAFLYLALYSLSYVASHFLEIVGPIIIVGGLIYGAVSLVQRGRGR
ncbi:hypothetical protein I6A84_08820 [Frankia sp. CNm7]|uniref:Uncharacterized protein n=1 Tax=Frankia nepalensis TaxID=1836974 RepID=A0A937RCQ0_9ACTN|nr:hypothetical protein [Frankia nepalensis]MBL7494856.1 hypothetical protein [Frankia nepalensis]MBL7512210.1 hypothetical protein [Frankia nepalensis]MBL7518213.1 hypothetical protein [Frankia nepalensis]MBL7626575.1 hypothetical protein [Frankia nepalensis]